MANENQVAGKTEKVLEYNEHGQKIWHIGTLTYTIFGLAVVFLILLGGDLIWSLRDRSVGPSMQILFKEYNASATFYSIIAITLPTILGFGIGPVISFYSDRHRGRWGRRIPFLFITTPLVVMGMIGMAGSKFAAEFFFKAFPHWSLDSLMLASMSVSWLFFDIGAIAGSTVFIALIKDVVPECFLGRFFGLFRMVSLATGILYNYWLIGHVNEYYPVIFLTIGLVYGLAFILICKFIKEGEYPPPPALPPGQAGPYGAMLTYIKESFGSRYYWMVFVMLVMIGLMFLPVNSFAIFYAKDMETLGVMDNVTSFENFLKSVLAFFGAGDNPALFTRIADMLGVYDKGYAFFGKCTALSFLVSFVLAYPLGALADRFHPLRCSMVVVAIGIVGYALTAPFIDSKLTFAIAIISHDIISGMLWTTSASLGPRLFPQARFAQFRSAGGMLSGAFIMLFVPAMGVYFDLTGKNYNQTFYMGMIIGIVSLIACLFFYFYFFKKQGGPNNYTAPEL